MEDRFLPGVPGEQIEAIYNAAPGKEIESGKFDSPESSAALAANTFGFFLNRPGDLPPLPSCGEAGWPATSLYVERQVRFPWSGGRHPWLDALVVTPSALIGVESKRYEPFRMKKMSFSQTYLRPVWGDRMKGYEGIRDSLNSSKKSPVGLDKVQLVKHALALRTQVRSGSEFDGLKPILFYLYAEPETWPRDGKPVDEEAKVAHREEISRFAASVKGDEVRFVACSYRELLASWERSENPEIREHARAVKLRFSP
ncbi:MAG: hypothetical protein F4X72_07535 [Dehalococcoidia bacterium]|nr:hypothetical protein [Dehalococcoidia bacterium]